MRFVIIICDSLNLKEVKTHPDSTDALGQPAATFCQIAPSHAAAFVRSKSHMELPVQITYRNMEPSDAVTARIEAEAAKLDNFFDRITSCRVIVETPHRHHRWGELFHVRIELGVPGTELVASHESTPRAVLSHDDKEGLKKHLELHPEHKDVYVAIRDTFASARRQLQDYVERLRGEVKTHRQAFDPLSKQTPRIWTR